MPATIALPPAPRRALAAAGPHPAHPPAHHPVRLGGPRNLGTSAPLLLQRDDDDFIQGLLDDLRTSDASAALQAQRASARSTAGLLKLYPPVQRQFHLAVLEAWCDTPGQPRLNPADVAAAGLVLRRLGPGGQRQGWLRAGGQVRGWLPLARVGGELAEPDPALRLARSLTQVADIDRSLLALAQQDPDHALMEDSTPLFVAPPEVCAAAGRTWLYGLVSPASGERSGSASALEAAAAHSNSAEGFGPRSPLFRNHLVEALRGEAMDLPYPGQPLNLRWADALDGVGELPPDGVSDSEFEELGNARSANGLHLRRLLLLLRQLGSEFNAFDAEHGPADVRALLQAHALPLVRRTGEATARTVPALQFLQQASALWLDKTSTLAPEMPERWPAMAPQASQALLDALHGAVVARAQAQPLAAGRFDEPEARYVVRAWLRLKAAGPCPERTVWSDESEPFAIAPWYESTGAPPVQIPLPDPSNRALLKALKPNVAFVVPPGMANLLNGSAKDLLGGKGSTGQLGITWVCSFSIPIITICAFLVLNIFLTLFNIVFGWMFFLKICLPLPKFGNKPPGSEP